MEQFDALLEITDVLHGPKGCLWDREQTFHSLKPCVLEEAHEVIDAIDEGNDQAIIEELGDLLYIAIFYAKVADREGRFTIKDVLQSIYDKLIRRHPHVFGEEKAESIEDVYRHWNRVKSTEREKMGRESVLDGIPKTMPLLARSQKMLKRMQKSHYPKVGMEPANPSQELAQSVLTLVQEAVQKDIDLEGAFRSLLSDEERKFRAWEKENL